MMSETGAAKTNTRSVQWRKTEQRGNNSRIMHATTTGIEPIEQKNKNKNQNQNKKKDALENTPIFYGKRNIFYS